MLIDVELLLLIVGLAVGVFVGWFVARSRSAVELAKLEATLQATRDGEARLESSLRNLTFEARAQTQDAVADAVAPLHEALQRYERRIAELERDRVGAYESLREQVRAMHEVSGELRTETRQLVGALRAPQVRGRWGEHQLRRIVEVAGLLEHCDFDEQVTTVTDVGVQRPDLVVRLHGGRQVVVDAKAPLEGYLAAMEARDEPARTTALTQHARHLRAHVDALSAKSYWSAFEPAPEFVVLFVPADTFLDAALQHDPSLLEHAFAHNVVLATPATLVALLRTIAYGWRQDSLTTNAFAVHRTARELYARLSTMGDHLSKVGTALTTAVSSYNRAVGSLESRVLVSARKLADLGISPDLIPPPPQVDLSPRTLHSPELTPPPPHPALPQPSTPPPSSPHPTSPPPPTTPGPTAPPPRNAPQPTAPGPAALGPAAPPPTGTSQPTAPGSTAPTSTTPSPLSPPPAVPQSTTPPSITRPPAGPPSTAPGSEALGAPAKQGSERHEPDPDPDLVGTDASDRPTVHDSAAEYAMLLMAAYREDPPQ